MIEQGTDGLSRGDMLEGVLMGDEMTSHIPLAESALERSSSLRGWLDSWFSGGKEIDIELLDGEGWFERGHDIIGGTYNSDRKWIPNYKSGNFIWAPAPAGAKCAAQQLRQARLKRMNSCHIFVCPHLMTHEWMSHIRKSADLILEIKAGTVPFWPKNKHESLVIGLYFPFTSQEPWQLKRSALLVDLGPRLHKMWKEDSSSARDILQQLCKFARSMDILPICKLRNLLYRRGDPEFPLLY